MYLTYSGRLQPTPGGTAVSEKTTVTLMVYEWSGLALLVWDLYEAQGTEHSSDCQALFRDLSNHGDLDRYGNRSTMDVDQRVLQVLHAAIRAARKKRGDAYSAYERDNAAFATFLRKRLPKARSH
jgi:KaiC/GvpD/RAD55 family RecA-like ATPase